MGADKNKSFQLANDGLIIARMIALGAGEKEKKITSVRMDKNKSGPLL